MLYVMDDDVSKSDFVKLMHSLNGKRKQILHPQKVRKSSKRQIQAQMEDFSSTSSVVSQKKRDSDIANSERLVDFEGSDNAESSVEFISNGVLSKIKSVKSDRIQKGCSIDSASVETRKRSSGDETDWNQILNSESCESLQDAEELKVLLSSGKKCKLDLSVIHSASARREEDTLACNTFSTRCDNTDDDERVEVLKKKRLDSTIPRTCCHETVSVSKKCVQEIATQNKESRESSLSSEQSNSRAVGIRTLCEEDSIHVKTLFDVKPKSLDLVKHEPCDETVNKSSPALLAGESTITLKENGVVLSEKPSGISQGPNRKLPVREEARNHRTQIPSSCYMALDCEMVGIGEKGRHSRLARCSIVDYGGSVLYDKYILPEEPITDYRTTWSGITRRHMQDAIPINSALPEIKAVLQNKIVIGHAVYNDFKVIHFQPPVHLVRDTATCKQLANMAENGVGGRSLKRLSLALLGRRIQIGKKGHCSVEDARASLDLFKLVRNSWETELFSKWGLKGVNVTAGLAEIPSSPREEDYLQDKFWPL